MSMIRQHPGYLILAIALLAAAGAPGGSYAQSQEPRVIEVVAKRFAFEPSEVEVMVGERVTLLRAESASAEEQEQCCMSRHL